MKCNPLVRPSIHPTIHLTNQPTNQLYIRPINHPISFKSYKASNCIESYSNSQKLLADPKNFNIKPIAELCLPSSNPIAPRNLGPIKISRPSVSGDIGEQTSYTHEGNPIFFKLTNRICCIGQDIRLTSAEPYR